MSRLLWSEKWRAASSNDLLAAMEDLKRESKRWATPFVIVLLSIMI